MRIDPHVHMFISRKFIHLRRFHLIVSGHDQGDPGSRVSSNVHGSRDKAWGIFLSPRLTERRAGSKGVYFQGLEMHSVFISLTRGP